MNLIKHLEIEDIVKSVDSSLTYLGSFNRYPDVCLVLHNGEKRVLKIGLDSNGHIKQEYDALCKIGNFQGITNLIQRYTMPNGNMVLLKEFMEGIPIWKSSPEIVRKNLSEVFDHLHKIGIAGFDFFGKNFLYHPKNLSVKIIDLGDVSIRERCASGTFSYMIEIDKEHLAKFY